MGHTVKTAEEAREAMPNYTDEQLDQLRRMVGDEVEPYMYSDTILALYLDNNAGDMVATAADIWREKAGVYAKSVDITEAGSTRKMSDLYDNALSQAKWYEDQVTPPTTTTETIPSTTRRIVRR